MNSNPVAEHLYKKHEALIHKHANYAASKGLDKDEVVSAAHVTFMEAIEKYEPNKGQFSTFLWWQLLATTKKEFAKKYREPAKVEIDKVTIAKDDPLGDWIIAITKDVSIETQWLIGWIAEMGIKVSQKWIRKRLKSAGWAHREIDQSFREIKMALGAVQ